MSCLHLAALCASLSKRLRRHCPGHRMAESMQAIVSGVNSKKQHGTGLRIRKGWSRACPLRWSTTCGTKAAVYTAEWPPQAFGQEDEDRLTSCRGFLEAAVRSAIPGLHHSECQLHPWPQVGSQQYLSSHTQRMQAEVFA